MVRKRMLLACGAVWLGGCSLVPYQSHDPCAGTGYGKCVSASQAYDEAVSGEASGPEIEPGTQVDTEKKTGEAHRIDSRAPGDNRAKTERVDYKASVYRELKTLIDEPVTPMVRMPQLIRLLVMPYPGDRAGVKALYMPRTIFFMANDPEFVLGDYLVRTRGGGMDMLGK